MRQSHITLTFLNTFLLTLIIHNKSQKTWKQELFYVEKSLRVESDFNLEMQKVLWMSHSISNILWTTDCLSRNRITAGTLKSSLRGLMQCSCHTWQRLTVSSMSLSSEKSVPKTPLLLL